MPLNELQTALNDSKMSSNDSKMSLNAVKMPVHGSQMASNRFAMALNGLQTSWYGLSLPKVSCRMPVSGQVLPFRQWSQDGAFGTGLIPGDQAVPGRSPDTSFVCTENSPGRCGPPDTWVGDRPPVVLAEFTGNEPEASRRKCLL